MFSVYTQDKIDQQKEKEKADVIKMRGLGADPLKTDRNKGKNKRI